MKTLSPPLRDRELVELLADEPELLAFADALVATHDPCLQRAGRRRLGPASLAAAAAVIAAAAALALIAPWQSAPSLVDRALAAVGDKPVLHVVIAPPADQWPLVDVESGRPIARTQQTAIWFDQSRDLKKTVTTLDGQVLDETLETDHGGFTRDGPIYTCAWIAAHPVEATKARVSCNASMENGTTPRHIPERPPTLDEALAGFVDRYRADLASGRAREAGRGRIDGRDVIWLELPESGGARWPPERVAVDAVTYKPLRVVAGAALRFRVVTAETVAFAPSLFTKPEQIDAPPGGVGGSSKSRTDVSPQQGAAALGGTAVWVGPEWQGYRLVERNRYDLSIGYGPLSDHAPAHTTGIEFVYARIGPDGDIVEHSSFSLAETTVCTILWGWTCSARDPTAPGQLLMLEPRGLMRAEGLYVTIWNWHRLQGPAILDVARALRPVMSG
jgi:hypothetical protein